MPTTGYISSGLIYFREDLLHPPKTNSISLPFLPPLLFLNVWSMQQVFCQPFANTETKLSLLVT